jgi:hypothetical protein
MNNKTRVVEELLPTNDFQIYENFNRKTNLLFEKKTL